MSHYQITQSPRFYVLKLQLDNGKLKTVQNICLLNKGLSEATLKARSKLREGDTLTDSNGESVAMPLSAPPKTVRLCLLSDKQLRDNRRYLRQQIASRVHSS